MEKEIIYETKQRRAGHNISWAAIFAGAVTFIALELVFALISSAIGLGSIDLYDSSSWSGAGTNLLIWTAVSLVIAFFISGLVSGLAAGRAPGLHGFLTWSLAVFMIVVLFVSGVGVAVQGTAQLLAAVGRGGADVLEAAGESVADAVKAAADEAKENFELKIDENQLEANVKEILIDSEVEELHPDYLKKALHKSLKEIQAAAKEAAKNPEATPEIAKDLIAKLQERAQTIAEAPDQEAVVKTIAKNSDLSKEEAREASEKAIENYKKMAAEAKQKLVEAEAKIEELKQQVEVKYQEAKAAADDAIHTTAKVSAYAAVAFVVSAIVAMLGAGLGRKIAIKHFDKIAA
ncbi:MAG: hypothetical protein Q4P08_00530 [Eubacteriales bacterium]|nr:hypothetical protein [Eubacteriales bacterium]